MRTLVGLVGIGVVSVILSCAQQPVLDDTQVTQTVADEVPRVQPAPVSAMSAEEMAALLYQLDRIALSLESISGDTRHLEWMEQLYHISTNTMSDEGARNIRSFGRHSPIRPSLWPPAVEDQTDSWRGLTVAPEERCSPYDADDYSYSQSLEGEIVLSMGGIIYSPYTGEHFYSTVDTDIEHIVARSEAHDSGLCAADAETRRTFASDMLNLTLAGPGVNRILKGDRDAGEWLPTHNQCWFADHVQAVKTKYGLTVDQVEADALERVLSNCAPDGSRMIVLEKSSQGQVSVPQPSQSTPASTGASRADALSLYDDNGNGRITCAEARAHGIAPVSRGHPAYEYMRDQDGDGQVCE